MTNRMDKIIAAGEECGEAFALAEREAIVGWLRELQFWTMDRGFFTPRDIAAEIERGEHLAKNGE
jgi:hypothetical protein